MGLLDGKKGLILNIANDRSIATYIAANCVRNGAKCGFGFLPMENREKSERRVRKAMEDGAVGMSTGLRYSPGGYATTEEIVALARELKPFRGFYATHMRDEGERIFEAMDESDVPFVHHSFFYEPPYFPGYRDIWGNVVVARAAAHPWGAERLTAYCILSGLFDRYPNLRLGFAECSAGWLPGWLVRLGGQKRYMRHAVPETKLDDPLDYARAGHVFCGIELYEGETLAKSIVDVVGEDVLMYQSDYPHPGGEFPDSPAVVLGWTSLGEAAMTKLLSGNAERFLRL